MVFGAQGGWQALALLRFCLMFPCVPGIGDFLSLGIVVWRMEAQNRH